MINNDSVVRICLLQCSVIHPASSSPLSTHDNIIEHKALNNQTNTQEKQHNHIMADDECDYLVIGGGATGMAFSDTLLQNGPNNNLRVVVVDKHEAPGGQWHDSYDFVQLHQPSSGYGVESKKLEKTEGEGVEDSQQQQHRATRSELLQYYADVRRELEVKHDFEFIGGSTLDLGQLYNDNMNDGKDNNNNCYTITNDTTGVARNIRVRKRLVDARNLEPDLPVSTPPRFVFPADTVSVVPVNDIVMGNHTKSNNKANNDKKHFVVIGGGKTGMDAVSHLLTEKNVVPENLLWVVPNDAWITARENIGNCIDLLYTSAKLHDADADADVDIDATSNSDSDEKKETDAATTTAAASAAASSSEIGPDFFQRGFLEWEQQGHVYRLDPSVIPTKFKDATLSFEELAILQKAVPRMVRNGRISEITHDGSLVFQNKNGRSTMGLPFPVEDTLFLHCSAGAFHCSKSHACPPPIFQPHKIIVQDVYGTPGFCFVGSMLGKLESMENLSDDERNAMTRRPLSEALPPPTLPSLGKSGGDVLGALTNDHQFVQRAHNLRMWLDKPELKDWVFANRLFHMAGEDPAMVSDKIDYIFEVLRKNGIVGDN